jgi:hypothetical protein
VVRSSFLRPTADQVRPDWPVVRETWVEKLVPGGFVAAFRMVDQDGTPVIAEVRVFPPTPRPDGRIGGTWSEDPAAVPPGGVTAEAVRAATLSSVREDFAAVNRDLAEQHGRPVADQVLSRHGFSAAAFEIPRHPGKVGRPDDGLLLDVAVRYAAAVGRGSRSPNVDVAREYASEAHPWIHKREQVRDLVYEARDRELLTKPSRGGLADGARLTEKAEALLAERSRTAPQAARRKRAGRGKT